MKRYWTAQIGGAVLVIILASILQVNVPSWKAALLVVAIMFWGSRIDAAARRIR
jgi:hypothetical protein